MLWPEAWRRSKDNHISHVNSFFIAIETDKGGLRTCFHLTRIAKSINKILVTLGGLVFENIGYSYKTNIFVRQDGLSGGTRAAASTPHQGHFNFTFVRNLFPC